MGAVTENLAVHIKIKREFCFTGGVDIGAECSRGIAHRNTPKESIAQY